MWRPSRSHARRRGSRSGSSPGTTPATARSGNLTDFTPDATRRADQRAEPGEPRAAARGGRPSRARKLDAQALKRLKKGLIERQARGLVEFVEPPHTLEDFVGNDAVKRRLVEDAALLAKGRLDAAPMGYLICGPVGTGKTYLAECFAGSVGIPCVKLRNFRSKYVGETEGNLEQILNGAAGHGARGRRDRRGRRGAGQPRGRRRLGHIEPGLLDDRLARWATPDIAASCSGCS